MAGQNAGSAQYAPTSVPSIGPPQKGDAHALPVTGYDAALWLLIALVLVAAGVFIRGAVSARG